MGLYRLWRYGKGKRKWSQLLEIPIAQAFKGFQMQRKLYYSAKRVKKQIYKDKLLRY